MADKPPACLFVIIGATGDLMRRKLLPAPYPSGSAPSPPRWAACTLVFAGGIGENAPLISADARRVKVRVIRTDEQLMIARSVARILNLGSIRKLRP